VAAALPAVAGAGRLGVGLGRVLHALAGSRRRIALRNLELCLPELPLAQRQAIVKKHFEWLGRSLLERGVLWHASYERLKRLIRVEGDIGWGDRHPDRALMWLVPHFIGMDVAGVASQLLQGRRVATIYQAQSNKVFDDAIRRGRYRFGQGDAFSRHDSALPLVRAIKRGCIFFNLPDMDFGLRDAAFVPFFGVSASTLLAPSRMARSPEDDRAAGGDRDPARRPGLRGALRRALGPLAHRRRAGRRQAHERVDRSRDPPQPQPVPVGAQALQDPARRRGLALRLTVRADNRAP
jgi:lauroyl/myristoyl acyltransferase